LPWRPPHFPPHPYQHSAVMHRHGSCETQSITAYRYDHSSLQSWDTSYIQMAFPLPPLWLLWQRYVGDIMKIAVLILTYPEVSLLSRQKQRLTWMLCLSSLKELIMTLLSTDKDPCILRLHKQPKPTRFWSLITIRTVPGKRYQHFLLS